MEQYHKVGAELPAEQRSMYFQLGAEIQGSMTRRLGFKFDAAMAHEIALIALMAAHWDEKRARDLIPIIAWSE